MARQVGAAQQYTSIHRFHLTVPVRFITTQETLQCMKYFGSRHEAEASQSLENDVRAAGQMLTGTMFGLAVMGRTGFSREALDGIVESTLASLMD